MVSVTDTIDAEYTEKPAMIALEGGRNLPAIATEEQMNAQLAAFERFKAAQIKPKDWKRFPGIDAPYLEAETVDRICVGVGVSWEIISKNEDGDFGVRCKIVDKLGYAQKTVEKRRKDGSTYKAEVDDLESPMVFKVTRYTVTIRTVALGRHLDVEGSFDSDEMKKTDYQMRQQACLRARRLGAMKLIGGVDQDVWEEERGNLERAALDEQRRSKTNASALFVRGKEMGLFSDGASFVAWAKEHCRNCNDLVVGATPTPLQAAEIKAAIDNAVPLAKAA